MSIPSSDYSRFAAIYDPWSEADQRIAALQVLKSMPADAAFEPLCVSLYIFCKYFKNPYVCSMDDIGVFQHLILAMAEHNDPKLNFLLRWVSSNLNSIVDRETFFRTGGTLMANVAGPALEQAICNAELSSKKMDLSIETVSIANADAIHKIEKKIQNPMGVSLGPTPPISFAGGSSDSRCFVATAAFGSADVAPVLVLREFRDEVLDKCWVGSRFVCAYYRISPPIAELIRERSLIRNIVRYFVVLPASKLASIYLLRGRHTSSR